MWKKREIYEIDWKKYLRCSYCWELKEMSDEFWHKSPNTTNWYISRCKECISKKQKEYYFINSDKKKEQANKYRLENIDKIKEYREKTKEHIREHWAEYRKNSEVFKEYQREYYKNNRDKIQLHKKIRRKEAWYWAIHLKTARTIKKLWIRPKVCPICWEEKRVEAHHPNNDIWYEIVRACNQCHQRIHNWWIECPKPINLLEQ